MNVKPNDALIRFHKQHFPNNVPIDSFEVLCRILEELNRLMNENERGLESSKKSRVNRKALEFAILLTRQNLICIGVSLE